MTKIEKTLKELSDLRTFYLKIKNRTPTRPSSPSQDNVKPVYPSEAPRAKGG